MQREVKIRKKGSNSIYTAPSKMLRIEPPTINKDDTKVKTHLITEAVSISKFVFLASFVSDVFA